MLVAQSCLTVCDPMDLKPVMFLYPRKPVGFFVGDDCPY